MTNEEAARLERYRAVVKKIKTPDEMRRFMDDPASDPELARQIADAANFLLRLMAPEGSNSNPPENGPEVHQYDGFGCGSAEVSRDSTGSHPETTGK